MKFDDFSKHVGNCAPVARPDNSSEATNAVRLIEVERNARNSSQQGSTRELPLPAVSFPGNSHLRSAEDENKGYRRSLDNYNKWYTLSSAQLMQAESLAASARARRQRASAPKSRGGESALS
jgi:hypothetical protein